MGKSNPFELWIPAEHNGEIEAWCVQNLPEKSWKLFKNDGMDTSTGKMYSLLRAEGAYSVAIKLRWGE